MELLLGASLVIICIVIILIKETLILKLSEHDLATGEQTNQLKIVQLSDLHGRIRFLNGSISRWVNQANPDCVVITGDLTSRKSQWYKVLAELKRIQCEHILFVPGNYERETWEGWRKWDYTEQESEILLDSLREQGVKVLINESYQLQKNGRTVTFYGYDNSIYGNESGGPSRDETEQSDYTILLAHSPSIIRHIKKQAIEYNLLLVGHTHGGQIRLFGWSYGAYKNFHVGLKQMGEGKHFYIHRGSGTVRLPLRIECPPEIALFRI